MIERPLEACTAFASGDRQQMAAIFQAPEQGGHPLEQGEFMITCQVMEAIAIDHRLVSIGWQIGNSMAHRIDQPKTNHVSGAGIVGLRQLKIAAGGLDGIDDSTGRVEQRPIPVENDQLIFHLFSSTS